MNVGELKDALDGYGDHLPVVVVIDKGASDLIRPDYDVETRDHNGEPVVTLTVLL